MPITLKPKQAPELNTELDERVTKTLLEAADSINQSADGFKVDLIRVPFAPEIGDSETAVIHNPEDEVQADSVKNP